MDSIQQGRWQRYKPQPALITACAFMERDSERTPHWIDLQEGEFIQGLVARFDQEWKVYVVTIATPDEFQHIHDRWPRVVTARVWGIRTNSNHESPTAVTVRETPSTATEPFSAM